MSEQAATTPLKPSFIKRYFSASRDYIENITGQKLSDDELAKFKSLLNGKITKTPRKLKIRNTLTNNTIDTDVYKVINMLCTTNHILSGYGMIYDYDKRHDNYAGTLLDTILKMRKKSKLEMLEHINDVIRDMYEMLNMRQLTLKLIANSWFGAAGASSFFCYDINIGASITYSGYVLISSVMLALETFIGNSLNFYKERDIFAFLNNCQNDFKNNKYDVKEFIPDDFNDRFPLDMNGSYRTAITDYLMKRIDISVKHRLDTKEMYAKVYDRLASFSEDELIRLVFKRNLTYFSSSKKFCEMAAKGFDTKFLDPMKCTSDNKEVMDQLMDVIDNFVSYYYCYTDRYEIVHKMKRKTVLVVDTDSVFMRLKDVYENIYANMDKSVLSGDDKLDTIVLCNVVTNIANRYIRSTLDVLSKNMNIPEEFKNRINMKSE